MDFSVRAAAYAGEGHVVAQGLLGHVAIGTGALGALLAVMMSGSPSGLRASLWPLVMVSMSGAKPSVVPASGVRVMVCALAAALLLVTSFLGHGSVLVLTLRA